MATNNFAYETLNEVLFLLCILVYEWGLRRTTPWTLPFTHEFSKHWLLREWNQHKNTVGQKKRKCRHLAHLVCVYLMPVANRAPILSQCSSRACSPVTGAPLSQTAATSTTIAINYSLEFASLFTFEAFDQGRGVQITLQSMTGRLSHDSQSLYRKCYCAQSQQSKQGGTINIIIIGVCAVGGCLSILCRLATSDYWLICQLLLVIAHLVRMPI